MLSSSKLGRATVHDRDKLIYSFSSVYYAPNKSPMIGMIMHFQAQGMLRTTNKQTIAMGTSD